MREINATDTIDPMGVRGMQASYISMWDLQAVARPIVDDMENNTSAG